MRWANVPVGSDNVDVGIDSKVLAIAAADVKADGAGREAVQEALDDGPWLLEAR